MVEIDEKALEAAKRAYDACFPDAVGITHDGMETAIRAYLSALGTASTPVVHIPEIAAMAGLKPVPVNPTREMWAAMGDAAVNLGHVHHDKLTEAAWRAGVAAAPSPPTTDGARCDPAAHGGGQA